MLSEDLKGLAEEIGELGETGGLVPEQCRHVARLLRDYGDDVARLEGRVVPLHTRQAGAPGLRLVVDNTRTAEGGGAA